MELMTTKKKKATQIDSGRRKYSEMQVKPVMIYLQTQEQRDMFDAAAAADNRKLSPFIVHAVTQYIKMMGLGVEKHDARKQKRTA